MNDLLSLIIDISHSLSISILSLFVLESVVKVWSFGVAFLRLGWDIFDVVVVAVTFSLDVLMHVRIYMYMGRPTCQLTYANEKMMD